MTDRELIEIVMTATFYAAQKGLVLLPMPEDGITYGTPNGTYLDVSPDHDEVYVYAVGREDDAFDLAFRSFDLSEVRPLDEPDPETGELRPSRRFFGRIFRRVKEVC